jgi:hypothetical protein
VIVFTKSSGCATVDCEPFLSRTNSEFAKILHTFKGFAKKSGVTFDAARGLRQADAVVKNVPPRESADRSPLVDDEA